MAKAPIEMLLDGVTWIPTPGVTGGEGVGDDIPYATHSGVLEIMGHKLRCYRLSNGMDVFDAGDVEAFFGTALTDIQDAIKP